jgi:hypothetical protein
MKYVASTDYDFINDFWSDNVVTVALHLNSGGTAADNFHDFYAQTTPVSSCTIPSGKSIVATLELWPNGEYEVQKDITTISQNDYVYINVVANFKNGEYINETQCVQVVNNDVSSIGVQFRGRIEDYNSGVNNYQITLWH